MIRKRLQIMNQLGLHARAATKFVQMSSLFESQIEISKNGKSANGKSIMAVMMLAAGLDTWVELTVSGPDEIEALTALEKLIANRFGESQ